MERFAIKIDKNLRANLYKICRLCGIDNPDKVKVLDDATIVNLEEGDPELCKKVLDCIGLLITKDDKMPQFMCTLCVDKINDFFEFREMCYATDIQTRKLLGIKEEPKLKLQTSTSSADCKVEAQDVKQPIPVVPAQKPGRKRRNADMEVCNTLKEFKTDDVKDVKPSTANTSINSPKTKRLKLENSDLDTKTAVDTKTNVYSKVGIGAKSSPAAKLGLAKKRLKMEPNPRDKKDLKPAKASKLIKSKLKTEAPPTAEDRRLTPFQLKKKKALELLKQRKLAKQVAVVKVEKIRKVSTDAKIKEETPHPAVLSGSSQPKVKLKEACSICNDSYVNKTLLDKHIKTTHIPTIARYHCVQCNETLKKNMEIKNHNLWHKLSKTPFQCGNCAESSCSIYTYSKHIRDCGQVSYLDTQIPDWHCPDCQAVFETTYLFNIHSCVSNTLVCPGCDRSHKWKEDYFKHIPTCAAAVHRIPSYMTPNIQVKNEAEHPNSPIPQHHAHTLPPTAPISAAQPAQTSRITPPLMDSNQCVVIPGNVGLLEEAPSSSPKGSCKKSKRITKKDLKRFDKLLKSTMTTLVSIKQEPTQYEGNADRGQSGSMDARGSSESPSASPEPADDHFYNDDDESADEHSVHQAVGTIKQEILDDAYRDLYSNIEVNVKREITDNEPRNVEMKRKGGDTTGPSPPAESPHPKPVLKLKITKEHGTLNSILLDSPKSEKKKKKKKRKEEKHREREDAENMQRGSTKVKVSTAMAEHPGTEPTMPLPEIVRVKQEIADAEEEKEEPTDAVRCVPSIVAATSGSLQISCVSEGVNFNGSDEGEDRVEEDAAGDLLADQHEPSVDPQEPLDIKPRLEDLIPTLQIASVSSGVEVPTPPLKKKRGRPPGSTKASTLTPKILSVASGKDVAPFEPELEIPSKGRNAPCEKVDKNENVFDFTQVKVKEEIFDPAFDEHVAQVPQKDAEDEVNEALTENQFCDKQAEENAYIANLDFNNLIIKQEKEYIDDGLDNPLAYEDDDDSDTDSESTSDSDHDDSESEREYRDLPSENDEDNVNVMSNSVLPPMGLQISDVRSEFTCPQPSEKTESEKAARRNSEDRRILNTATECKQLDVPTTNSDQSAEGNSSWGKEQEGPTNSLSHAGTPGDSSPSLNVGEAGIRLSNSESDLQTISGQKKEGSDSSTTSDDPYMGSASASNEYPLLEEVDNVKEKYTIDSISQRISSDAQLSKSLAEEFRASLDSLTSNSSNMLTNKQDDLRTGVLSDLVQTNLLPISMADHFSPAEVSFTVMPVERAQTDHSKTTVDDLPSGTSTDKDDGDKSSKFGVPGSRFSPTEVCHIEKSEPEDVAKSTEIDLLDFPLSTMDANNEPTFGETEGSPDISASTSESICKQSRSPMVPSGAGGNSTTTNTLQSSPSKMFYNTGDIFPTASPSSAQNTEAATLNEDRSQTTTDENLSEANAITESHIDQQAMLMEPPISSSLTLHLPSFGEPQTTTSQIFNTTIGLDSNFSADLERQNLDDNVSIDLSDVLSNSTLHAPSAVAVISPHSDSHLPQSAADDTANNIPMYSSNLQHMSSDTNFIESSLNFTELCRNNSSLGNLSDFHIHTSSAGDLQNLMSPTESSHPSQLMSSITSSTNNPDLNVPVLSEEVQNLLNEDAVAASDFELNDRILRARCSSSINAFSPPAPVAVSVANFTDMENVNEIAENNNNANIERELQDELGNALAAAIADRSPNDEVDENNVMNENRANFDLT